MALKRRFGNARREWLRAAQKTHTREDLLTIFNYVYKCTLCGLLYGAINEQFEILCPVCQSKTAMV